MLGGLRHHAIPIVYEAIRAQHEGAEAAFLAMEYVEGESLAQVIAARRPLGSADAIHLFVELLGVLDYLHTRVPPVLHRDIKPANVILRPDGTVALVDFGAVRNVFRSPEEAGSTVVGTYGYAPYEQFMGQAAPSSDLYALGATFLHLVTGRAPPEFMSSEGRIEVPPSLSCGEPMRGVLARLLAASPAERYQSAREARNALLSAGAPSSVAVARAGAYVPATSERPPSPALLAPVPRAIEGETATLLERATYRVGDLMDTAAKPGASWTVGDVLMVGFFSLITVGIMPAVFWSVHSSRARRLRPFFERGLPAAARVIEMTAEPVAFGSKLTRVKYEFGADGRSYLDSDSVLPTIAGRWTIGTAIQVLYIPDRDYDSVIVSTG